MVSIRFSSLVLLGLLYLLHALIDSSAYAHEGSGLHGNKLMDVDDVSAAADKKTKLRGRKMMAYEVQRSEIEKDEEELNGGTSEISGNDASQRTGMSLGHFNNQINNSPMLKPSAMEEAVHFPSTKPRDYYFQESKAVSSKSENQVTLDQNDGSQSLLDDDEIANLMRKDYSSTQRSPPVNNHEPND